MAVLNKLAAAGAAGFLLFMFYLISTSSNAVLL